MRTPTTGGANSGRKVMISRTGRVGTASTIGQKLQLVGSINGHPLTPSAPARARQPRAAPTAPKRLPLALLREFRRIAAAGRYRSNPRSAGSANRCSTERAPPRACPAVAGRVVMLESGRLLELVNDRVKRAVLVMRRAEVAQWYRLTPLLQVHRQPRFADPRSPGSTTRPSHAPPAASDAAAGQFFVTTDQRSGGRAQCFETAVYAAWAQHPQAGTGSENPLSATCPRSSQSNNLPTSWRVLAPITTVLGSAPAPGYPQVAQLRR